MYELAIWTIKANEPSHRDTVATLGTEFVAITLPKAYPSGRAI
jgi:hypothetical protein